MRAGRGLRGILPRPPRGRRGGQLGVLAAAASARGGARANRRSDRQARTGPSLPNPFVAALENGQIRFATTISRCSIRLSRDNRVVVTASNPDSPGSAHATSV